MLLPPVSAQYPSTAEGASITDNQRLASRLLDRIIPDTRLRENWSLAAQLSGTKSSLTGTHRREWSGIAGELGSAASNRTIPALALRYFEYQLPREEHFDYGIRQSCGNSSLVERLAAAIC